MSLLEYSEGLATYNPKTRLRHKCHFCKFLTTSFFCAVNHARRHQAGVKPYRCQSNIVEKYFCRTCNYTTDFATEFNHHIYEFHTKQSEVGCDKVSRSYLCEKCGFETYSSLIWFKHELSNHKSEDLAASRAQSDPKQIKDSIREDLLPHSHTARQKQQLSQHSRLEDGNTHADKPQKIYDEVEWYGCDQCEYKTDQNIMLEMHRLQHLLPWYRCDQCSYRVKQNLQLHQHTINVHLKDREIHRFECDKCSYVAKQSINFKLHYTSAHPQDCEYQIQSGRTQKRVIRTFKCDRCPQEVCRMSLLVEHVRTTHLAKNDADWVRCRSCNFRAKHVVYLKMHDLEKHSNGHNAEWFKCDKCCYKSRKLDMLVRHQRKHLEEDRELVCMKIRWYACEKCDYMSSDRDHLLAHKGREHPVAPTPVPEVQYHLQDHNYCRNTIMSHLEDHNYCK